MRIQTRGDKCTVFHAANVNIESENMMMMHFADWREGGGPGLAEEDIG